MKKIALSSYFEEGCRPQLINITSKLIRAADFVE